MSELDSSLHSLIHQKITARLKISDYKPMESFIPERDTYSVYKLKGESEVLEGFLYTLDFVSDESINVEEITDLDAEIYLRDESNPLKSKRIYGKIVEAKEKGSVARKKLYQIKVVSPLQYLSFNQRYAVYQEKTVPEIISSIVLKYSELLNLNLEVKIDLQSIPKRHTCTQYKQSDLDFIKMLCKQEGYVLLFDSSSHEPYTVTLCELNEHAPLLSDVVECSINFSKEFSPSAQVQDYYENAKPSLDFSVQTGKIANNASLRDNESTSQLRTDIKKNLQRDRLDKLDESLAKDLLRYAKIDAERQISKGIRIRGNSEEISLCDGCNVRLKDIKGNKSTQAIILATTTQASFPNAFDEYAEVTEDNQPAQYSVNYEAIPSDIIYKSKKPTDVPRIEGIISAIVANGDKDTHTYANEIDVNEFAEIRLIFHFDENHPISCYVPLATPYSGDGYGTQFIPRVNSEVMVEFINGDIDRPIITGAIHNGENRHPYSLPKEKTKSFIKTQTTPQYEDKEGYNELLFEDKQNEELLSLRAQNDYKLHALHDSHTQVQNTSKTVIDNDEELTVQNDLKITIGKELRESIGSNSKTSVEKDKILMVKEDQELHVLKDVTSIVNQNQTTIVQKDLTERIKGLVTLYVEQDAKEKYLNNLFTQVGKELGIEVKNAFHVKADTIKETAKTIDLNGADGISLKVGGTVLTVDSSGIHFKTPVYDANSGNAGVTSSAVNIKDLEAPLYQKFRVTEITGIKKQSSIDETLTYTAKVEKFENGEWKETGSLEETQKVQINWFFIKNEDQGDTDLITDSITDDDIEKDGLNLTVNLQDDNIQQFAHVHAYFSDPESEGYFNTELKRNIEVEEIRGHSLVDKNDLLEYDVIFNVDNITDGERKEFIAEVVEINKDETQKSTKYELEEDLIIKHPLEKEKIFKKILVQVTKKEGL